MELSLTPFPSLASQSSLWPNNAHVHLFTFVSLQSLAAAFKDAPLLRVLTMDLSCNLLGCDGAQALAELKVCST